jgi:predicted nucleic acid-binding Zn ribbon protein
MIEIFEVTHSTQIPEIFYSDKEKKPFSHCKVCGKNLIDSNELYVIEKAFAKKYNTGEQVVEFELACCLECRESINASMSKVSRKKIEAYFIANTQIEKRDEELKKYNLIDPDIWLQNCVVKNKSIDEVDEFQIYALCYKDKLIFNGMPLMICGEAVDEIMELLSNKSLGILNDFMADLIDLPPEFSEIIKNKTPMFF